MYPGSTVKETLNRIVSRDALFARFANALMVLKIVEQFCVVAFKIKRLAASKL